MSNGLSIIVPVYNEVNNIQETIDQLIQIRSHAEFPMELIFVNDGSSDGTKEILDNNNDIIIIHNRQNLGYGATLKRGINSSTFDIVAFTDADGTYPNDRIPDLYQLMIGEGADMLVGERSGKDVHIPLIRRPAKWVLNRIANYLSGQKIPDLNSGLRLTRRDLLLRFSNILPNGFSLTTTITLALMVNGFIVIYEPISYFKRGGKSKIRPIYDTLNFLQLIIRTIFYFNPLKFFLPLSFLFPALSTILFSYRALVDRAFLVSSVIFFVAGIQLFATGMLADMINKRIQ